MPTGSGKTIIAVENASFYHAHVTYIIHTCPRICMETTAADWERCGYTVHFLTGNKTVTEKHRDKRLLAPGSPPKPYTVTMIDHDQLRKGTCFSRVAFAIYSSDSGRTTVC